MTCSSPTPEEGRVDDRAVQPTQAGKRRLNAGFGAGPYVRVVDEPSTGERTHALRVLGLTEQDLRRFRAPQDGTEAAAETLGNAVTAYVDFLRSEGKRPRGVHEYHSVLKDFVDFHGKDADVRSVMPRHVSRYLAERLAKRPGNHHKQARGEVSVARRALRHSVLAGFFRWCQTEYGIKRSPVLRSNRPPRIVKSDPDHLAETEVSTLLGLTASNGDPVRASRDRTLIKFMLGTGARVSEAAGVRLGDVHLRAELPHVYLDGKGGKRRCVDLPPWLAADLAVWIRTGLRSVVPDLTTDTPLFCNLDKEPGKALSPGGLGEILRRLFRRLKKRSEFRARRYHPHAMRHTYAIRLAMGGVSIAAISAELGHAHIETTMVYQRFSRREKVELLKKSGAWDWNPEGGAEDAADRGTNG